jgi:transcriptional regulator with XRE-family HTH domain
MVGKLLKQFSVDTGISQKEVAERLSFSPQRINNYYRDAADPPREFFEKFRTEFHVDLKKLLDKEKKGSNGVPSYNPIPVYDLELKPTSDPNFFNHNELIAYYVDAPLFNDCFAAVKVSDAAMSPAFNPSDLIAIRKVKVDSSIPYGEPFLIITEEQRFLRYIRLNEKDPSKTFLLRAENPSNSDDIVIKKSEIKHLFQVKGKMSRR